MPFSLERNMKIKILSCGAGMQSTALALMSCENKKGGTKHKLVPIYDAVIFCDLGIEPNWVYDQVQFVQAACEKSEIPFYILETPLYQDYINNFGKTRVTSVPFWSVGPDGKHARMRRNCTIDYKIMAIQRFVKYEILGYRKYQRLRPEDIGTNEMHIGFSVEEKHRAFASRNLLFQNHFPLIEMGLTRADNYKYILEKWGLETKASACCICPFHRNYFFEYLKNHHPDDYIETVRFDRILEERQPDTKIKSKLYISRSRKRIEALTAGECRDAEYFLYRNKQIWNGF